MLTEEMKKDLTEKVLGECWHEWKDEKVLPDTIWRRCKNCKRASPFSTITAANVGYFEPWINQRTFTTRDDMLALYRRLHETGRWYAFTNYALSIFEQDDDIECPDNANRESWFTEWLLCLSGTGYEERCAMVGEFPGIKGGD